MKQATIIIFFPVFLLFFGGCGYSTDKKEKLKDEIREELKAEMNKEADQEKAAETTESQNEENSPVTSEVQEKKPDEQSTGSVEILKPGTYKVKVRFSTVVAASDGAFYVFENVHGQDFHFYSASETTGLEFTNEIMPAKTPAKYDDIWFNVVFERGEKDFYHSGSGKDIKRDVFIALEVSQTDIPPSQESNAPAFSAGDLKISQFSGTEPFWSMNFLDNYIKKTTPSGEVRFYYLQNGQAGNYKLADVIEPVSSDAVKIEVTDESEGAAGVITITRKACDDGMSDNEYPYSISFVWKEDGRDLNGCGDIKQYP